MKEILKGSAIIFLFKIGGAVSLFLVHIIISRYYGAEMLGVFNLILALMTFGTIVSRVGLDMYVVRIIPELFEQNKEKIAPFIRKIILMMMLTSAVVGFLYFVLAQDLNRLLFRSTDAANYIQTMAIVIVPFTFFNVFPEIFRAFHDVKIYSFFRNLSLNMLLMTILTISLLFSLKLDPVFALFGVTIFGTIAVSLILYRFLKQNGVNLLQKGKFKEKVLSKSFPMLLTSSMMFLMGYVDSFMIGYYLNEYEVGIYSACIKLSFVVTFVLASVNGFIAPKLSQAYTQKRFDDIKQIYFQSIKLIVVTTLPVVLLLYVFPEFFLGLFGKEFIDAKTTLFIVNTAFFINALCGPVGYILNMTDNQHIFMKIMLFGLLINIAMNFWFIPHYGINGAAFATLISMGFWNVLSLGYIKSKNYI